jgi:hypothetical protein
MQTNAKTSNNPPSPSPPLPGVNNPMSNQTTSLLILLALLSMAAAVFGGQQLFCHYLFDVRLGSAAVEIVIFKRFVTFAIPYDEITRFDKVSFWEAAFSWGFNLVNRPFGTYVLLHRTRGFFRRIVVSPSRPDEFCDALIAHWNAR